MLACWLLQHCVRSARGACVEKTCEGGVMSRRWSWSWGLGLHLGLRLHLAVRPEPDP